MTKAEAKTKWCPFGKRLMLEELKCGVVATNMNEPDNEDFRQNCIASGCMMWRSTGSRYGFCGLSGRTA